MNVRPVSAVCDGAIYTQDLRATASEIVRVIEGVNAVTGASVKILDAVQNVGKLLGRAGPSATLKEKTLAAVAKLIELEAEIMGMIAPLREDCKDFEAQTLRRAEPFGLGKRVACRPCDFCMRTIFAKGRDIIPNVCATCMPLVDEYNTKRRAEKAAWERETYKTRERFCAKCDQNRPYLDFDSEPDSGVMPVWAEFCVSCRMTEKEEGKHDGDGAELRRRAKAGP